MIISVKTLKMVKYEGFYTMALSSSAPKGYMSMYVGQRKMRESGVPRYYTKVISG